MEHRRYRAFTDPTSASAASRSRYPAVVQGLMEQLVMEETTKFLPVTREGRQ